MAFIIVAVLVLGGVAGGAALLVTSMGTGDSAKILTHRVERGDLVITVTEDGNVESASNKELKCELENGSTILSIVEDGTQVSEGDVIVELDSAPIENELAAQRIIVEKARATQIQAAVDVEVAEISIQEYLKGTYLKELQEIEKQITIAQEDLNSAKNTLDYTQRMMRKGYATPLQLDAQKFAVERAKLELATAKTAKTVLEEFTKQKMLKDLEAQRDAAQARLRSEQAALATEESTLKRLEQQLEKCIIKAPQDGMVVYANERSRWSQQSGQIEEGTSVRSRQTIVQLPDLSQMQVKVTVHETKVESLRRGMPAVIRIQDRELKGEVMRIATQPEAGGWMQANVKEYATIVKIEGQPEGLKPGMTAEVEILVDHLKDVLTVPVQAVVGQRGKFYCWVKTPGEPERREVLVGTSNDKFIQIKDGLLEGDEVLLNPRAAVAEAREEVPEVVEERNVEDTFGASASEQLQQSAPSAPAGAAGPAGGPPDASASAEGDGPRRQGGGGRGGFNLMQFDQNGDGKVAKDEAPEQMREFFDRMDPNGDGFIDAQEIAEMQKRFQDGGGRGGRGGNLMDNDKDGDGKVSRDEAPEGMQRFFDRMDANGDGFIDAEEVSAMRARGRRGGGGRGGGEFGGPGE